MKLTLWVYIFQPCWGFYLQGSVKVLALVEIGVQVAAFFIFGYHDVIQDDIFERKYESLCDWALLTLWIYMQIEKIMSIILAIILFNAATQRAKTTLKCCLFAAIFFYLTLLAAIITINFVLRDNLILPIAVSIVFFVYKIYSFWVLYSFIREITMNGETDGSSNKLTDAELDDFFMEGGHNSFHGTGYNKEFEIPISNLRIDYLIARSRPESFGIYKAELSKINGTTGLREVKTVAVKTAHRENFMPLMRELMILNCIGKHKNLVNLIGACTKDVKQRKLYLVMEYCSFGDLLSYLIANKEGLMTDADMGNWSNSHRDIAFYPQFRSDYTAWRSTLSLSDLLRWAADTARGMEFIASERVIHGDLAARNVLLSFDRRAKITNFGLSTKLYTTFAHQNNDNLPLKWMSPEAITDLRFSTYSDVYSYGITLWEYFSAGQTPYAENRYYDTNFIEQLKSGELRPGRPEFASEEIYQEMSKCWALDPTSRPTFTELRITFEKLYMEHENKSGVELFRENIV
ncbi:macrophage colony-stimulating factor 1 receptor 2 isoform X1 [Folsomia candida]|uniref:macrophage colony-stimulating factor 1 receptor 2 isoform X1 n=1 Tax=Folsomia candida TaxID=158441 RepID=UPI000B8F9D75|nr:macrophage colony-stimulating factor 1 receptor 2 isoform X1 [Folsomia candida]